MKLNQRVCAICGKTDAASRVATCPYPFPLLASLAEHSGKRLKMKESGYAHPMCVRRLQLEAQAHETGSN